MLVVRCYCLPGNPDKLGQHVVGHCPAAELDYVVAQAGLQQDARSHPYTLLRSGLYGGHASGAMLLFARKSWQTRATCGRALSCCRIRLRCCTSGTATGRKISPLYLTAVILPATIINCDFIPWAMPPLTITEPPTNRSRSTTQASAKRSPRRRYTRRRPSAR